MALLGSVPTTHDLDASSWEVCRDALQKYRGHGSTRLLSLLFFFKNPARPEPSQMGRGGVGKVVELSDTPQEPKVSRLLAIDFQPASNKASRHRLAEKETYHSRLQTQILELRPSRPPKIKMAEKSLRFQIGKCKIANFLQKSQKSQEKVTEKSQRFCGAWAKKHSCSAFSKSQRFRDAKVETPLAC